MTRCQLLLSLLEDAGERGITTSEILEAGVGSRYGARLMELRKAGHSITSERVREGSWKYTLVPEFWQDRTETKPWEEEHARELGESLKLFESAA